MRGDTFAFVGIDDVNRLGILAIYIVYAGGVGDGFIAGYVFKTIFY